MKINNVNSDILKKNSFKLCVGVVLGLKIFGTTFSINNEEDRIVSNMSIDEKMQTRGGVHIYFNNKDYNMSEDWISFFDDQQNGYGFVSSDEEDFLITFEPGKYNFYLEKFNEYGTIDIDEPGEILDFVIDYKDNSYTISNNNVLVVGGK